MNLEQARENMIKQQLRTWDVLDETVLHLMESVPREQFVPSAYHNLAYADTEIPLANGHVMLSPKVEGQVLQALAPKASDTVLQVGVGSGYLTAILAKQAKRVIGVELDAVMLKLAEENLKRLLITNVILEQGDGADDWHFEHYYDVIVLSGAVEQPSQKLMQRLNVGGRLFAVVGREGQQDMKATLVTRQGKTHFSEQVLFETCVKSLVQASVKSEFIF